MKKNILLVLALIMAALCTSCSNRTYALAQLRELATDVQTNGAYYSLNDWQRTAKRYGKVEKKISKNRAEYSPAELKEIGELRGQLISGMATGIATQAKGHVDEFGTTVSTILDQIKKKYDSIDDWKNILKPFVEQLNSKDE